MSMEGSFFQLSNGSMALWEEVPETPIEALVTAAAEQIRQGARLCAWFGLPVGSSLRVVCVLARDAENLLALGRSGEVDGRYPALTLRCPEAQLFERELWEQHGVVPEGHPWLKPVRLDHGAGPGVGDFFQVQGREVHEVAVGPVHAGIIEPGHFRFQCAGEEVLHLEIALGYQHRGVETALVGGPHRASYAQMQTVAGDTTVAHATAYAMVCEALAGAEAPLRAQWLRAMALELERLANHTGDLGALANDVAFLPASAACGKLRGDFLNLTALVCGNRFGRNLVTPGGCLHDLEPRRAERLRNEMQPILAGVEEAAGWLWDASSVRSRFEGTGSVTMEDALKMGLVGPAARASGVVRDVRFDHAAGWHRFAQAPVAVWAGGDVAARARVRWLEAQRSGDLLAEQLESAPEGEVRQPVGPLAGAALAVALVEGWRGEVCHVAVTGADGRFQRYKIVDPSFHNWTGLAWCLRGQAISDFPLCNKSFNLSYSGFDL